MSAATPSRAPLIILGTRLFAEAVCAIGTTERPAYVVQIEAMGFRFATVVHPTARISRTARVRDGSIVSAGVVAAARTEIGRHVILDRGALIGPHTAIGDGVAVSPGAVVVRDVPDHVQVVGTPARVFGTDVEGR